MKGNNRYYLLGAFSCDEVNWKKKMFFCSVICFAYGCMNRISPGSTRPVLPCDSKVNISSMYAANNSDKVLARNWELLFVFVILLSSHVQKRPVVSSKRVSRMRRWMPYHDIQVLSMIDCNEFDRITGDLLWWKYYYSLKSICNFAVKSTSKNQTWTRSLKHKTHSSKPGSIRTQIYAYISMYIDKERNEWIDKGRLADK